MKPSFVIACALLCTPLPPAQMAFAAPLNHAPLSDTLDTIRITRSDGPAAPALDIWIDGTVVGRLPPAQTAMLIGPVGMHHFALSLPGGAEDSGPAIPASTAAGFRQYVVAVRGNAIHVNAQHAASRRRDAALVLAFNGEDESWTDISPPPAGSIFRKAGVPEQGIQWKAPNAWPVRSMTISGSVRYEFDPQGRVLKIDDAPAPAGTFVAEEMYRGKPAWDAGRARLLQIVHEGRPLSRVESERTFVLTPRGAVCPTLPVSDGYRQVNEIPTSIFSGKCDQAGPWAAQLGSLAYPYRSEDPDAKPTVTWTIEYFERPAAGNRP